MKYNRFFSRKWIGSTLASVVVESRGLSKNELKSRVTDVLNRNGAVVIEGYYNDDQLLALEEKYSNLFSLKDVRMANKSAYNSECLPLSNRLLTFWYDDLIIDILKTYIGRMPVARGYPLFTYVNPKEGNSPGSIEKNSNFVDVWHLDHSTLIQPAIYLTDVKPEGSHMEVLAGTHRYPNVASAGFMSNEYVLGKQLKILPCYGSRGSVQIHCGNVYHRFMGTAKSERLWLKFEMSSGNNILFDRRAVAKTLTDDFDFENLPQSIKGSLAGLYPDNPEKGYQLVGKYITPSKFKGI